MGLHIAWDGPRIYLEIIAAVAIVFAAVKFLRRA